MKTVDDCTLLLSIARQHEQDAFTEIFNRYREPAYNLASKILGNSALADDAVQQAMLALWQSAGTYRPDSDVRAWILGLVVNRCLRLLRTQAKHRNRGGVGPAAAPYRARNPENLEQNEQLAILRRQFEKLPGPDRQILAYYYGAELSQRRISELTGIPQKTISRRLQGALEQLRLQLTHAGQVAVLPLATADGLKEAILSGSHCPEGLLEAVWRSIQEAGGADAVCGDPGRASDLACPAAGGGNGLAGMLILFAVLAVGATWVGTTVLPSTSPPDPRPPFFKRWDFRQGGEAAKDFPVLMNAWRWQDGKAMGASGMAPSSDAVVLLPSRILAGPMHIRAHLYANSDNSGGMGCGWANNKELLARTFYRDKGIPLKGPREFLLDVYLLGPFILCSFDVHGPIRSLAISRYESPYPAERIALTVNSFIIRALEIRSISRDEIPPPLREPDRLLRVLGKGDSMEAISFSLLGAPPLR